MKDYSGNQCLLYVRRISLTQSLSSLPTVEFSFFETTALNFGCRTQIYLSPSINHGFPPSQKGFRLDVDAGFEDLFCVYEQDKEV